MAKDMTASGMATAADKIILGPTVKIIKLTVRPYVAVDESLDR